MMINSSLQNNNNRNMLKYNDKDPFRRKQRKINLKIESQFKYTSHG